MIIQDWAQIALYIGQSVLWENLWEHLVQLYGKEKLDCYLAYKRVEQLAQRPEEKVEEYQLWVERTI